MVLSTSQSSFELQEDFLPNSVLYCSSPPSMALLSVQSHWYSYLWLLYVKIYSALLRLVNNHCRRSADKSRSVISAVVNGQSPGGIHKARTHRRRKLSSSQQHVRVKHIVALTRRPSLRRIVMAPGASTAHAMMEDKEKTLNGVLNSGECSTSYFNRISQTHCCLLTGGCSRTN